MGNQRLSTALISEEFLRQILMKFFLNDIFHIGFILLIALWSFGGPW